METTPDHEPGGSDRPASAETATPGTEPVLRIEFYGNSGPVGVKPDEPAPAVLSPLATDSLVMPPADSHDPSPSEAERTTMDEELNHRQGVIAAQESEALGRAAALARREQALVGSEGLIEAESADIARRERRLAQMESTLKDRATELDDREVVVEQREIELEAAFSFREDRVEQREAELADLESRLERKEQDLARYVSQVQAEFARRA